MFDLVSPCCSDTIKFLPFTPGGNVAASFDSGERTVVGIILSKLSNLHTF